MAATSERIRRTPYRTGGSGSAGWAVWGKSQSQIAPTTVTTASEQVANARMVNGSDNVRPYMSDSGLKRGAARAKARMVPPGSPARRISRTTGMTPSEQTGSSMPISQPTNSPFQPPPPNRRRVFSGPRKRRKMAAMKTPARMNGAACSAA